MTSCSRRGLEIEQVKHFLLGNGYSLSRDNHRVDPSADIILLSTCGFTQAAEDYGFETLQRVEREKKPSTRVILGGCIPGINPERVAREFKGPAFDPQHYERLDDILNARKHFSEFARPNTFGSPATLIQDLRRGMEILRMWDGSLSGLSYISRQLGNGVRRRLIRSQYANLHSQDTFYIQIQEGCSMHCAYCAIRLAIGPMRSKPLEAVIGEIECGLSQGYRRFQLVGDNAGGYGLDIHTHLGRLLERILDIKADFELDLTDINPVYLASIYDPLRRLCNQKKVSQLYVPIQSASRRVLKLMGRDCDMRRVKEMLIQIKNASPDWFRMGTSLVVGFPSETLDDLEETIQYCKQANFDWVWCHSYSARPETPAACLPGQIPAEEILHRAVLVQSRLRGKSLVTTANDTAGSRTCQG